METILVRHRVCERAASNQSNICCLCSEDLCAYTSKNCDIRWTVGMHKRILLWKSCTTWTCNIDSCILMEHLSPFNPNLIQSFHPHQGLLFKMKRCLYGSLHYVVLLVNKAAREMESVLLQNFEWICCWLSRPVCACCSCSSYCELRGWFSRC
jgi:hypothetical protein